MTFFFFSELSVLYLFRRHNSRLAAYPEADLLSITIQMYNIIQNIRCLGIIYNHFRLLYFYTNQISMKVTNCIGNILLEKFTSYFVNNKICLLILFAVADNTVGCQKLTKKIVLML